MKKGFLFLLFSMLIVLLGACGGQNGNVNGSQSYAQTQTAKSEPGKQAKAKTSGETKILLLKNDKVGDYLADGKGMTLYYYTKDAPGVTTCTAGCLQSWPAFYGDVSQLILPSGFNKADFGTITRGDTGKQQMTFKGYPLYYYIPDLQKGDVNGQGVGGVWYVINNKTNFKEGKIEDQQSSTTTQDNNNGY